LSQVVAAAVETSRPLIEQRGHKLITKAPAAPIKIDGDLVRLAQVISNLLNNAAKYTERGGRIWLECGRKKDAAVIKVRDTGVGIPPQALPRIFEMFTQAGRENESRSGLGIGLTLVKRLVEMHGGTITAHSEGRGKGSEFVIRIPVALSRAPQANTPVKTKLKPRKEGKKPIRILVVDDNQDSADSLGMLMKLLGNDVRVVNDGLAAVEVANEFEPQVVLLDIGLPTLNGYEAARKIRKQAWGSKATLIAVTGWGETVDRQRSKKAGFDHHLVKPVEPDVLTTLLATLPPDVRKG
jgi:CheY-like chemotaxis protein